MPTIDQLAQATASSDGDELVASQNGTVRKVTRAQLISGLQPQLAVTSGSLLGRNSAGTGSPEQVAIGTNLVLANGTLSGSVGPFAITELPAGVQPAANDLIPIAQNGHNAAVTYAAFLNGAQTLDASQMTIKPAGFAISVKLADFAATALTTAGAKMNGPITLANYSAVNLPSGQSPGAKAFAVDGRKPGEGPGAGTGVEVFFDGARWISVCSGIQVIS